jgi:uncharacterized YccA/Bax inhibitor family protein
MKSSNPVFSRNEEFRQGGYATFDTGTSSTSQLEDMYAAPPATPGQMGRMTYDDVVVRTATVFGVLLAFAAITFIWMGNNPEMIGVIFIAMIIGLVLGLVNSFKREPSPALILAYAAVEGVFVGGISRYFEFVYSGIVVQAVLGTLAAFGAMLLAYRSRVIRATPKFRRTLIVATIGYFIFGLVHLVGVWLGLWQSVYSAENGVLALGLGLIGVTLASLFLILDFDFIEQGVRNGLPQRYAWTAAFGLTVTLIWLYLEILRLIYIIRSISE